MRTAILTSSSPASIPLARLTAPSQWLYAASNGYDLIQRNRPKDDYLVDDLMALENLLLMCDYERVLMIDPDVVFTNTGLPLEKIVPRDFRVCMSREAEGRAAVNAGVSLWSRQVTAVGLLNRLIADRAIWQARAVGPGWQEHVADTPDLLRQVTILEPRAFCATDQSGEWRWQPGDLLCHLLGGTIESKIERVRPYLTL